MVSFGVWSQAQKLSEKWKTLNFRLSILLVAYCRDNALGLLPKCTGYGHELQKWHGHLAHDFPVDCQ